MKQKDNQSFTMCAKIVYKSYNQNDNLLFPPSLGELIPENHPVRTVSAIIDRLDISDIESTYKGGGTSRLPSADAPQGDRVFVYEQRLLRAQDGASAARERELHVALGDVPSGLPYDKPLP